MADTPPNSSPGDAGGDSLASLHRMSTTAGVSSQEYVAVNLTAVAAAVAGLATSLIFLSPLWLAVPAIAIIMGLVALRQISHSNGTQTGRLLAWGGIILAAGIAGFQLGGQYMQHRKEAPLRAQVLETCDRLGQLLNREDYQKVWDMFSDRFRSEKKIDFKTFSTRWAMLQGSQSGKIKSVKSNGLVDLDLQREPVATTMVLIEWQKSDYFGRYAMVLSKSNGVWQIEDLPTLFPTPMQAPASGSGPGGPAGPGGPGGPQ